MLIYLAAALAAALVWLRWSWSQVRGFWARRAVPHDPPHPFFGSLSFLQKLNPGLFMVDLYKRFGTPYVGIWLFWRPALVVNSPELARRILVKDADNFRNRMLGSGTAKSDPIGGLNLFTVNEPIWSSVRRRLTPVFTSAKLRALHDLQVLKAKELNQRIESNLRQNKDAEIRSLYADYTTDIIGTAAFGIQEEATLTGESSMRTVTKDFMKYNLIRGIAWTCIFFLPEAVKFFKFTFFPKHSVAYFRRVYRAIVAQRSNDPDSSNKDLIDALLNMKRDADKNGEEMPEDLVIAQAAVFLQGGFDTTAVTLSFMTYELAFKQEAQERLYRELLEARDRIGGGDFDSNILSELPFFNSVIKEILRKYPPMGWLDRIAEKEYRIDDKLTIPAGTTLYVNAIGMHYDPQYFPDPEEFIPERFMPENQHNITPFTYLPFGEGPRNCIGMRFAYRSVWYAASYIFLKYRVQPKPNAKKPQQVEMEKNGMFLAPGEELYVDFIPRS